MKVIEPKFTKIAGGLEGSEGPVFDTRGNFYAVAPMEEAPKNKHAGEFLDGIGGKLYSIDLETGVVTDVCTPQFDNYGGRPAGCQSDKEDSIWIADMRLGLLKWQNGNCTQISKIDSNGDAMQGGNDLIFDDDGNLWFTAPGGKIAPETEERTILFKEPVGCIYCLRRGETVPVKVDEGYIFCNGIANKGNLLLVAETVKRRIIAYDIVEAGKVTNRRVWAQVPKDCEIAGGPDGMDFDVKGNLLVANHGQGYIEVYSPDGGSEPAIRIKCPFATPSNVHFKQGTNLCFVTEHDTNGVWSFEWEHEGMTLYCDKHK